jgi:hypothetical protein
VIDPVLTKRQNYRLWQGGAFGNKLRAWETLDAWRASRTPGPVAIRVREGLGGGLCLYDVFPADGLHISLAAQVAGVSWDSLMANEMAPHTEILQGEYLNDVCTIDGEIQVGHFFHSRVRLRMRDALKVAPQVAHGLRADLMIREAMTPASYEDWRELLVRYPGHVLEVSIYENCLGDLPHRNALVWEVRKY